jgi:hypothetical protein
MEKIDLKKTLKPLYSPPRGKFVIVNVPPLQYFMIDGKGDPNTAPAYAEAIEALFSASYTLKFLSKTSLERDYVVPPLEALWWADDMSVFTARAKSKWSWTAMIMVHEFIDAAMARRALAEAAKKKDLAGLARIERRRLVEGRCVQTLHVGSYDEEGPTLAKLHAEFLPENKLVENGMHHEIYLSDARKVVPEKLRTILRQPVRAKR